MSDQEKEYENNIQKMVVKILTPIEEMVKTAESEPSPGSLNEAWLAMNIVRSTIDEYYDRVDRVYGIVRKGLPSAHYGRYDNVHHDGVDHKDIPIISPSDDELNEIINEIHNKPQNVYKLVFGSL